MSSVMNPYVVVTYSLATVTTNATVDFPLPFAGEVVGGSLVLGTTNTATDFLGSLSKNGTATVTSTTANAITSIAASGSNWLVTTGTGGHGLSVGQSVVISGAATAAANGTYTVLTVPTALTFTVAGSTTSSSGGYAFLSGAQSVFISQTGGSANTPISISTASPIVNGVNLSGTGSTATGITQNNLGATVAPLMSFAAGDRVGIKVTNAGTSTANLSASLLIIKK
jgi:hypothetical protein